MTKALVILGLVDIHCRVCKVTNYASVSVPQRVCLIPFCVFVEALLKSLRLAQIINMRTPMHKS